jgi:hypothetical protein
LFLNKKSLLKEEYRFDNFKEKYLKGLPFELVSGGYEIIPYSDENYLKLLDKDFSWIRLSKFLKSEEFGGRPNGSIEREHQQLERLKKIQDYWVSESGSKILKIKYSESVYEFDSINHIQSQCKADFSLSLKNEDNLWISHKAGSKPEHFPGWGGMSKRVERVYYNTETLNFFQDVKQIISDNPNYKHFARKIYNEEILNVSMYGKSFGSSFGENNVQMVLQGDITLTPANSSVLELKSNFQLKNGDLLSDGYSPFFVAQYSKGNRSEGMEDTITKIVPQSKVKYLI